MQSANVQKRQFTDGTRLRGDRMPIVIHMAAPRVSKWAGQQSATPLIDLICQGFTLDPQGALRPLDPLFL